MFIYKEIDDTLEENIFMDTFVDNILKSHISTSILPIPNKLNMVEKPIIINGKTIGFMVNVAGFKPEEVSVKLKNNFVAISATTKSDNSFQKSFNHQRMLPPNSFVKNCSLENGILYVYFENKNEEEKILNIEVK